MNLLCRLGWHTWTFRTKWTPSINADFVTRFEMWKSCVYCPHVEKIADDTFKMTKKELELRDNHTCKERNPYIGIACDWCNTPKNQWCPSCDWRYTKLYVINRFLDGDNK